MAFHFDPLIYFPGWEEAYQRIVERLGNAVPSQAIAWISLGGLRLLPPLRQLMLQRFPRSRIAAQEMVLAPDGKLRYFKSLRVEMYARMREWLTQATPEALVYLCMESPRVWQEAFGFTPDGQSLARLLGWTSPAPTLRAAGSSGRSCPGLCGPDLSSRGRKRSPADACVPREP